MSAEPAHPEGPREPGPADAAGAAARLDRLVHEPARLAILAILAVVEEADFPFVRARAGLTGGNLASHLAKLEDAGLVRVRKSFEGRRPVTSLALTDAGRAALSAWRAEMGRLIGLLP